MKWKNILSGKEEDEEGAEHFPIVAACESHCEEE